MKKAFLVAWLLACSACIDAAQKEVALPLSLAGDSRAESFESGRGFAVELDDARLAFGPLYLCAGATAGTLCETALLEWTSAAVVDLLRDEPRRVGELRGLTGRVRSFMYDLGLTSLLTENNQVLVLDAARELSGSSLRLSGRVEVDGVTIPFRANLTLQQTADTEKGTQVVRSSEDDELSHQVAPGEALTIAFDARAWFQTANFSLWLEERSCQPNGPSVVCDGQTELTCDADGTTRATRACAERDEVCIAREGCVDEVVVDPKSQVGSALRIDLASGSSPDFRWSR